VNLSPWLCAALLAVSDPVYREALPGYHYSFPRDHFEHAEFRTEWWYYTGNARAADGKRFGFELVFFRQAQHRGASENRSAWRVDDLYLAHLALTEIDGRRFHAEQRLNRAGPGLAGASFAQQRVWNGNWSTAWDGPKQTLRATASEFSFELHLDSLKPPVIHGANGVSQKAEGPGRASHYVSFSRLAVAGEIRVGDARHAVTGTAWMDHEWFTHQLEDTQVGWDWFSIQLDDNRELMLFQLRRKDDAADPYSAGTYVDAQGRTRHLAREDFSLTPLERWISPQTKGSYPVRWRIRVPSLNISLEASAALHEQELRALDTTGPSYWEGAVRYTGSQNGVGYLEMTGYDKPVRLE
jgi:predicted secreted hydrolase